MTWQQKTTESQANELYGPDFGKPEMTFSEKTTDLLATYVSGLAFTALVVVLTTWAIHAIVT